MELAMYGLKWAAYLGLAAWTLLVLYDRANGQREGVGVEALSILLSFTLVSLF